MPINLFLVGLDSYLSSKTARFAQRELLRWAKYHRLFSLLVLDFFIFQFRKNSMSLKTKIFNKTAAAFCVLSGILFTQTSAFGAATMTIQPNNSGYVANLSGTINTAGLTPAGTTSYGNALDADDHRIALGVNGSTSSLLIRYSGISGGSSWGSFVTFGSVGSSGDEFVLGGTYGWLALPAGYQSGAAISSSATFTTRDILNAGTYTYTWGAGTNADSLTVIISPANPVPTVASVSPTTGSTAGGTAITITGTDLTGATITVGGAACTGVVASATSASCTTPAGTAGTASVLVTTSGGTNAANTLFTYQTNAVCGTAASVASSIVPSANLCTAGTAGQVSSSQGQYSWTCSGISGGTNASCTAPWATNAGTGSGSLSASGNGWTVSSASFAATPTATPPAGVTFPNGLLDLRLSTGSSGTYSSGTDATVVVQYTTAVPAGAVYMKYGKTAANQTDHWYQLDASRAVFASDRMSVTLTLTDGGAGDHDLLANGTIVDPGGPALVAAPTAVPTLSEWAMIFLASLMGMFAFARIRRQS
jgi:hypothetical protein